MKGGSGASGRVLPPVTGRSRVRVAVSSHCTGEGKACHWHPSSDPAQSGGSLHWVNFSCHFMFKCKTHLLFAPTVSKSYLWAYASFQFAIVILFAHIFYNVVRNSSWVTSIADKYLCDADYWLVITCSWECIQSLQSYSPHSLGSVLLLVRTLC